ncbi:MAG: hypothetical protein M0Z90_10605 [Desulfobacteraceae bacterium]|nr:hypothetical protein [Desulfobacteraceae bacterium]
MSIPSDRQSMLVVEYLDPEEGFKGWLVIDGAEHALCAGGMRVQPGLTSEQVQAMARNMTMKMRICGLPIDGAKCGIDYHPQAPGKLAAMTRFMAAIRPHIESRYSMGPDLNTSMAELEAIARQLGLPSVKMAIAQAQGLSMAAFLDRYAILAQPAAGGFSLGRLRAGFGVAQAALATLKALDIPIRHARVAVQGFGNLAKATIVALREAGATVTAIADAERCLAAQPGHPLPLDELLNQPGTLLGPTGAESGLQVKGREEILLQDCELLVLAALENVIQADNASLIKARAVIPGANLAVTPEGEAALFARGVTVLPSFVAGCGGTLAMNGLFGPPRPPSPRQVLGYLAQAMTQTVAKVLAVSDQEKINPTQAARRLCERHPVVPRPRPYACD